MDNKFLLNGKELAGALNINYDTFRTWLKSESFPHVTLNGRKYYTVETVKQWLINKTNNN